MVLIFAQTQLKMKSFNNKNFLNTMLNLSTLHPELRPTFPIRLLWAIAVLMCVVLTTLSITSNSPFLKEILISEGIIFLLLILSNVNKN
jgi:hypothetical protein